MDSGHLAEIISRSVIQFSVDLLFKSIFLFWQVKFERIPNERKDHTLQNKPGKLRKLMLNAVLSAVTVTRISKRKAERKLSKTPFSFENPGNILTIFLCTYI